MAFHAWLIRQVGRDDAVGDLADDVARDGDAERFMVDDAVACHAYLSTRRACPEAHAALDEAYREWAA